MEKSMCAKPLELLSPAGEMESLEACLTFGADAVYIGGKQFGMRASPKNFTAEQIRQAAELCHSSGAAVYLTCNTLPTNEQADQLPEFLYSARDAGVDGLIVSDIGILMLAKRLLPDMDIHISTQCGIVNHLTATELYNLGASRVVLARELSIEDIAVIRAKTPAALQLEAFVHGAMCMAFSGRCLISQYMIGRDANKGQCAQPCRWGYHLVEEKRPGEYFPVFEDKDGSYIMNAKDLSMLAHIDKLAEAGVYSFKIEGRGKSAYYAAAITYAYRQAMDIYLKDPQNFHVPSWLMGETEKVSHRRYSTGFYLKDNPPTQYYDTSGYIRNWDLVASVLDWQEGYISCLVRNKFSKGEILEVLRPDGPPMELKVTEIIDSSGSITDVACHPMEQLRLFCPMPIPSGSMLRRQENSPPALGNQVC